MFLSSLNRSISKKVMQRLYSLFDRRINFSYSQEGEDILLLRIFGDQNDGLYVDVGAHHPKRFSNTYLFYKRGWRGINIDAMPGSMKLFHKMRPRDINLEMGVANQEGTRNFYIFNEPALNGFSAELSEERSLAENPYHVKEVIKVDVKPLRQILDQHLVGGGYQGIDFLSVDVEGFDLEVLQSNDWFKYRPKFVLAEVLNSSLHDLDQDPVVSFMRDQNYVVYAKLVNTVFFKDIVNKE